MAVYTSLRNHFLIAMPTLADPSFARSVTYICEHTPEGSMGIVINHPLNVNLGEVLKNMSLSPINEDIESKAVFSGGPMHQERGFVIHEPGSKKWQSSLTLSNEICVTTSKDILEAMAKDKGPKNALVALGYAGWEAGQLEEEIQANSWLCGPADASIIFDVNIEKRWHASAKTLGVDIDNVSTQVGHA